ncbi:hypothetical protein DIPPA_35203 [Diplonema papillatum]|nr:hypothetical protein DIPPA_35203 [Diplonema papillatum]
MAQPILENPYTGDGAATPANPYAGGGAAASNPPADSGAATPANPYAGGGAAASNPPADSGAATPANPYAGGEGAAAGNPRADGGVATPANPYAGGGAAASSAQAEAGKRAAMMEKLEALLNEYQITIADANDLFKLVEFDVVVICDDSGSMTLPSGTLGTRWDELRDTVTQLVNIGACLDDNGIDLYFLNQDPLLSISSSSDSRFIQVFSKSPRGSTPLVKTMQRVIADCSKKDKPVLLVVATDGEPNEGPEAFKECVKDTLNKKNTSQTFKIQVLVCTPDEAEVEWLNKLDCKLSGFDVTDDYTSERKEVKKTKRYPEFKKSDYIVKALLGPVCDKFDKQDEKKPSNKGSKPAEAHDSCGCVVL